MRGLLLVLLALRLAGAEPAIDLPAALALSEDFPLQVVTLTGIRGDGSLAVTAVSGDPAVVPDPVVVHDGVSATALLLIASNPEANGSTTLSVTVSDGQGLSAVVACGIMVTAVNDPPRIDPPASLVMQEDTEEVAVLGGLAFGPADEAGQRLRYADVDVDPAFFSYAWASYAVGEPRLELRLTPAADAHGATLIRLTLVDDGGTAGGGLASRVYDIPVDLQAVDDPPAITVLQPLATGVGGTVAVDAAHLAAGDVDGDPITWTVATLPGHGSLLRAGIPLLVGDVFSQDDIGTGLVSYLHAGGIATGDAIGLTWSDGVGLAAWGPVALAIAIDGVSPVAVDLAASALTWTEGDEALQLAPLAVVEAPGRTDLAGSTLTIRFAAGWTFGDRLGFRDSGPGPGRVQEWSGSLLYAGREIGTVAGGGAWGDPLVVGFTSPLATQQAVQDVVRAVQYTSLASDPGRDLRRIELVLDDGGPAPALPSAVVVRTVPVETPPWIQASPLAMAAGSTRLWTVGLNIDASFPLPVWSLGPLPEGISAAFVDTGRGILSVRAPLGSSGTVFIPVIATGGFDPPASGLVPIVITAVGDPRPHPAGEFPGQVFRGETMTAAVPFDCRLLPDADLAFSLLGEVPTGMTLSRSGTATAVVQWTVPEDEPLVHRQFTVLATSTTTQACTALPVSLPVRTRPTGSN